MNLFSGLKGQSLRRIWKDSVPHIASYPVSPGRDLPQEVHALAQKTGLRIRVEGPNLLISGDVHQLEQHYAEFGKILDQNQQGAAGYGQQDKNTSS